MVRFAVTFMGILCLASMLLMTSGTAHAESTRAMIESPFSDQTVRIRWPETSLSPSSTGKLVAVGDANGSALPFSFLIAPEDQGHSVHPMWLVVRLTGTPPFHLDVGHDLGGQFVEDADKVAGRRIGSLGELSLATIRADAWGPITASLEDAQSSQRSSENGWSGWSIALAILALLAIAAVAAMFARMQARREDVSKL
jgi:hypothetical protein